MNPVVALPTWISSKKMRINNNNITFPVLKLIPIITNMMEEEVIIHNNLDFSQGMPAVASNLGLGGNGHFRTNNRIGIQIIITLLLQLPYITLPMPIMVEVG